MSQEINDILLGISLLERTCPMLKESTRETISLNALNVIDRNISIATSKICKYCRDNMILMPLTEIGQLIQTVREDPTFVETDNETKELLVDRLYSALSALYLFAGKFYMDHEFTFDLGLTPILKNIVDSCINQGFYFDEDKTLRLMGEII